MTCAARGTATYRVRRVSEELRRVTSRLYDIKDFPSCPEATSTNPSRWWRRWSRATSVLSQPFASPLVASPLWRLRQSSGVGATVALERKSET